MPRFPVTILTISKNRRSTIFFDSNNIFLRVQFRSGWSISRVQQSSAIVGVHQANRDDCLTWTGHFFLAIRKCSVATPLPRVQAKRSNKKTIGDHLRPRIVHRPITSVYKFRDGGGTSASKVFVPPPERKGRGEESRALRLNEKRIERGIKSMRRHVEASSVREWEVSTTVGCRSGKRDSVDQTIDVSSISWDLLSHLATVCHVWKSPQETCREEPSGYVCGSLLLSYIPSSTPSS